MDAPKKIKLFISYSRKDRRRIDKLNEALESNDELEVFRDTEDILPTEEWKPRLEGLIKSADVILFALSPDSVTSDVCQWELELADSLNKKIIPVVVREVDGNVPDIVSRLNYIFLTKKADFENALARIGEAITVDIDWIREHTRIGELADRWDQSQRLGAQHLRGKELQQAEQWLASQPKEAPAPTGLHRRYIYESRKTATKRSQMTVAASLVAVLIVGILSVFAWTQRNAAIEGERRAEAALRSATQAANTLVFGLAQQFKDSSVPGSVIESILDKARDLQDKLGANFPNDPELQRSQAAALYELGEVYMRVKSLKEAKSAYERSLVISRMLVAFDANNTLWQRDVSMSLSSIGNVKLLSGDVSGALSAYEEELEIHYKLADLDANNAEWQRDISNNLYRIGNVKLRSGDAPGALAFFEEGLMISRKLAALDANNTLWQRDVSVSLERIGYVKLRAGDAPGALAVFEEVLVISRKLAALDANNTARQRDISVIFEEIGDVKLRSGDASGALAAYEEGLVIARKLAALDADDTLWQNDVSVVLLKIGEVKQRAEDAAGALAAYAEALVIRRKLAALDSTNMQWQWDISFSLNKIGGLYLQTKAYSKSYSYYKELLDQTADLVRRFPKLAEFGDNAKFARSKLANLAATISYITLFDGQFNESEQKSREAIGLNPKPLWLKTNLAHALMLQDKREEATAIYLQYRGEKINGKLWEEVILADFMELKSKGIAHPQMAEIERMFKN